MYDMSEWFRYEFPVPSCLVEDADREIHVSLLHISRIISKVTSINTRKDKHAGEKETSLMLYFRPEVVGEKKGERFLIYE
jgi:creatinine amidohydrolase/Fe(II)-dependent formamide hydrolase-like protein